MSEERTLVLTVRMQVIPEMSNKEAVDKLFDVREIYSVEIKDVLP